MSRKRSKAKRRAKRIEQARQESLSSKDKTMPRLPQTGIKMEHLFIFFLFSVGTFLVIMASQTPFLGEDEAVYIVNAEMFLRGDFVGALPFFMPFVFMPFFVLFSNHLMIAKAIIAITAILTIYIVYRTGKDINTQSGIFSALLLLSIPIFTHTSMIVYVETPIAMFSALLTYMFLRMDTRKYAILTGIVLLLATLTKFSGMFLVGILFIYATLKLLSKKDFHYFKLSLIAIAVFSLLYTPFVVRNIVLYDYPYTEGLNYFFDAPVNVLKAKTGEILELEQGTHPYYSMSTTESIAGTHNYFGIFGLATILFSFLGAVYGWLSRNRLILLSVLILTVFMLVFSIHGGESRYLSIIFPQIAIIGGVFLGKLSEDVKYTKLATFVITAFLLWMSVPTFYSTVVSTQGSVRYSDSYISTLNWIEQNTEEDAFIFGVYGGSIRYYADRDQIWNQIKEYPYMMESGNSTYIYENLRKYNVSHIMIQEGLVGPDYFIPGLNIAGIFSNSFVEQVFNDTEHFEVVHQNGQNYVVELK